MIGLHDHRAHIRDTASRGYLLRRSNLPTIVGHVLLHHRLPSWSLGWRVHPRLVSTAAMRRWSCVPILFVSKNRTCFATSPMVTRGLRPTYSLIASSHTSPS